LIFALYLTYHPDPAASLKFWHNPKNLYRNPDKGFQILDIPANYALLMKWILRNLAVFAILARLAWSPCFAQNTNTPYQAFTVNEGMPQNFLLGLAQDSAGFIWAGTKDGLARYDGYNFKIYRHGNDSLHTPAFNNIFNLYTDHRGRLWIQYENRAIDCYDPSTGIFNHVSAQPAWDSIRSYIINYELLVDRRDNLWLITEKGVYRYIIHSRQLFRFNQLPGIVPLAIMEDHSGKIWMANQKGFNVYDYSKDRVRHIPYQLSTRQTYSGRNHKLGIGETESGKIVVTSLDSTLLVYDPVNNSFKNVVPKIKKKQVYDSGTGNTNFITDSNGDRWFTCNGRIFRMDKRTDEISEISDPTEPKYPNVTALMVDRSGNLWFGKNAFGLFKINLNAPQFISKKSVYGNFETDILVNELGANIHDLPAGFDNHTLGYIYRNAIDTSSRVIWIQNYLLGFNKPKLVVYDIASKKIKTENISLSPHGEVGINYDYRGSAWSIGINNWRPYKINYRKGAIDKELIDIPASIPDSLFKAGKVAINPVVDDEMMWVMTSNASIDFGDWTLVSIHLRTKQIRCYPVIPDNAEPSSSLLMMVKDPSNPKYLWIGTTGNGLIRFDKTTGQSHAFTTEDGLSNNTIYAIVPDDRRNLWLSSNRGLTRFNLVSFAVRNFDVTDGLISNEFNRWHCFKLPDGRIAFGGVTGYTIFNPAGIWDDEFQPRVLLTNLLINNKALPGNSSVTSSSLDALSELVLPYDQNFLTFEFASDEYNATQKISYRYRLANFDNEWVYTGNERLANYTKLPPGKYTLEINAANISGVWSNKIKSLQIIIIPPWWQTWWAYSIYILIALGLLFSFLHYHLRRVRLKQEMILQQKQTEQLKAVDEMKSRFFSNITHEFRTPLSLIISPVEKLQTEITDERVSNTLFSVQRNANRLLQLINQLLDLSKLEAGNMQLNFSRGRLDDFIKEMVSMFLSLAAHKQIDLSCDCELSQDYLFEADKLKTILFNLLSNAVKFTTPGGKITVCAREEENKKIRLSVTDTGIGIPPDKLPFIFNRFFQVDDSRIRSYEGTGIGLALVKELVELMNGTVAAESHKGTGTTITLVFPIEKPGDSNAPLWQKEIEKESILLPPQKSIQANSHQKEKSAPGLPLLLLVEDNEELLAFLCESFEQHKAGFRVLTANNGQTALRLAKEELPDLVISDVMMPGMDGYTLCRNLKTDKITSHIAVILLTAKISYESRLSGLQLGADDYINKPFHFDELETRIRNLLDHQEKQRTNYRAQLQQKNASFQTNEVENPFLKNIYAIIEDMIDDPQLGASRLAEKNAMSLRTLNRKLNTLIGLTAGDMIRQYRLQKSLTLLKAGRNVSEAAYMVGFETPAYFSQCFKEQYGVSPRDYFADVH
jgi:signal transduction histidine kinase/ligand-binding sensor domain-containing protein/DNA-binding NarL/FixJ family response regulator